MTEGAQVSTGVDSPDAGSTPAASTKRHRVIVECIGKMHLDTKGMSGESARTPMMTVQISAQELGLKVEEIE